MVQVYYVSALQSFTLGLLYEQELDTASEKKTYTDSSQRAAPGIVGRVFAFLTPPAACRNCSDSTNLRHFPVGSRTYRSGADGARIRAEDLLERPHARGRSSGAN